MVVVALAIVAAGALFAGLSYAFKARLAFTAAEGHNDITGFVFATVGVLYGVLLAFVVVAVWDEFTNAEDDVRQEAALMVAAYRDTQLFPDAQRVDAQADFRAYARALVAARWSTYDQANGNRPLDLLNPIYADYRAIRPTNELESDQLTAAMDHVYALEVERQTRHMSLNERLPPVFWLVLVIGGLITIAFVFVFQFSSRRVHAGLTGMLAASIVAVLALVLALHGPYSGLVQVGRSPYANALLQFDAIDRGEG